MLSSSSLEDFDCWFKWHFLHHRFSWENIFYLLYRSGYHLQRICSDSRKWKMCTHLRLELFSIVSHNNRPLCLIRIFWIFGSSHFTSLFALINFWLTPALQQRPELKGSRSEAFVRLQFFVLPHSVLFVLCAGGYCKISEANIYSPSMICELGQTRNDWELLWKMNDKFLMNEQISLVRCLLIINPPYKADHKLCITWEQNSRRRMIFFEFGWIEQRHFVHISRYHDKVDETQGVGGLEVSRNVKIIESIDVRMSPPSDDRRESINDCLKTNDERDWEEQDKSIESQ